MGKYERVFEDLCTKIDNGTYPVGSLLPSEKKLTEQYGMSRETVRKALTLLTDRGYIQKIMGKGSVVIHHPQYALPVSDIVSYKEFSAATGSGSRSCLFALEQTTLPLAPFKDLYPDISEEEVTYIGRLRYLDGKPAIIDRTYIARSVIPSIPQEAAEDSLYEYFEKTLGLKIAYSTKQIRVEPATAHDRELMRLAQGEYVAVTVSVTSLEDTTVFEFTESRHRADKFVYQDFARRR